MNAMISRINWMLENNSAVKVSVFKGEVSNFELRINNETGSALAFGSLKCEKEWSTEDGRSGIETYYANFSAFDDVALGLTLAPGDRVTMLTEHNRRKGKDDTWYENNVVMMWEYA